MAELRRFHHVNRNVYAHKFGPENIERLIKFADEAWEHLQMELTAFASFLEHV